MIGMYLQQYKIYLYGVLLLVFLGLCGSTYMLYLKNKNKDLQITQLNKESKFWQESYQAAVNSHNEYVGRLEKLQKVKNKVQTVYVTKVEEIDNANIGNITEPYIVVPSGLQAFSNYTSLP